MSKNARPTTNKREKSTPANPKGAVHTSTWEEKKAEQTTSAHGHNAGWSVSAPPAPTSRARRQDDRKTHPSSGERVREWRSGCLGRIPTFCWQNWLAMQGDIALTPRSAKTYLAANAKLKLLYQPWQNECPFFFGRTPASVTQSKACTVAKAARGTNGMANMYVGLVCLHSDSGRKNRIVSRKRSIIRYTV